MDDPVSQLAYYRQQLAMLQRVKNPGPDVAALRLNIREAIALLEDALDPQASAPGLAPAPEAGAGAASRDTVDAPVPASNDIFESLNEDKEAEDAVSSDDDMFRCTCMRVSLVRCGTPSPAPFSSSLLGSRCTRIAAAWDKS
jgi:hypothetical protein